MLVIRKIRRDRDITQKQLGELVGVTQQAVTKWEKGLAAPRVSMLPKIAAALDCSVGELLGENPSTKAAE